MPRILILDGGLGTSLEQNHNVKFTPSTPLWSSSLLISDPATLLQCQASFASVPVDILLTATYQVSLHGFRNTKTPTHPDGISPADIPPFLETAVDIAETAARSGHATVALSVGPYGACMIPSQEYSGRYDEAHNSQETLYEWHRERMRLFSSVRSVSSRVAYTALETIPRVDEIVAMRRALDAVPDLARVPFWMSCLYPGDDERLPSGETAEEALRGMLDPRLARCVPWGVGINCTKVWKLTALLKLYEAAIERLLEDGVVQAWPALVVYPDGTNGEVYNTVTQVWEPVASGTSEARVPWEEQLAEAIRGTEERGRWRQIVVGGCCMASSEDIARLRRVLA
jgi:homocysteine S-methyltransferase